MNLIKKIPVLSFPRKRWSIVFFLLPFYFFLPPLSFSQNINVINTGKFSKNIKVESTSIDSSKKTIIVNFNKELSYIPFRQDNVKNIYDEIKKKSWK